MDKQEYIATRLSSNRDDRCDDSKLNIDAELRGSLGRDRANKIIDAIDNIKMER
jgi:hypothetical protein